MAHRAKPKETTQPQNLERVSILQRHDLRDLEQYQETRSKEPSQQRNHSKASEGQQHSVSENKPGVMCTSHNPSTAINQTCGNRFAHKHNIIPSQCVQCTFLNPSIAIQCQMCGNPFTDKHNTNETRRDGNGTASSLEPQLEHILKEYGLYDDSHQILSDNNYCLEDLKMVRENEVDEFCNGNRIGLSLVTKLRFRRLIKDLHGTNDQSTPTVSSQPTSNETKQSEEDQHYAQIQAKKKAEKSHLAETLKSLIDDKMTVISIGDTHAGKTSLFRNFIGETFEPRQTSTIGIDSDITVETLDGTNMEVHVIDTAGQARWQAACRPYYKRADCIFVCFSVVDEHAAKNMSLWRQAIEDYAPDDVVVMLVGCKTDLIPTNREVYQKNRTDVANMMKVNLWKKFTTAYFECSSKTGRNVEILYKSAVQAVMEHRNPLLKTQHPIQLHHHVNRNRHTETSCCMFGQNTAHGSAPNDHAPMTPIDDHDSSSTRMQNKLQKQRKLRELRNESTAKMRRKQCVETAQLITKAHKHKKNDVSLRTAQADAKADLKTKLAQKDAQIESLNDRVNADAKRLTEICDEKTKLMDELAQKNTLIESLIVDRVHETQETQAKEDEIKRLQSTLEQKDAQIESLKMEKELMTKHRQQRHAMDKSKSQLKQQIRSQQDSIVRLKEALLRAKNVTKYNGATIQFDARQSISIDHDSSSIDLHITDDEVTNIIESVEVDVLADMMAEYMTHFSTMVNGMIQCSNRADNGYNTAFARNGGGGTNSAHRDRGGVDQNGQNDNNRNNRNFDDNKQNDDRDDQKYDPDDQQHPSLHGCNHVRDCTECSGVFTRKYEENKMLKQILETLQQQIETFSNWLKPFERGSNKSKKKLKSKLCKSMTENQPKHDLYPSYRAKNNIKLSRKMTQTIIPNAIKEPISNVFAFMEKSIGMQYNDGQIQNNTDAKYQILNCDLYDQSNTPMYCIIKRVHIPKANWKYQLEDQLFTANEAIQLSDCPLPRSSRLQLQDLQKMNDIEQFIFDSQSIRRIIKQCKWNRIPVFTKKENKQRLTLSITHEQLNPMIKRSMESIKNATHLIPILMFDNTSNTHWIEHILVVHIRNDIDLGISLRCDAKHGGVRITGIHLDKVMILEQHEVLLSHKDECHCLDGFRSIINDMRVGNCDALMNEMRNYKQKYHNFKVLALKFINGKDTEKFEVLQQYAERTVMHDNRASYNLFPDMTQLSSPPSPSSSISSHSDIKSIS